MLSANSELCRTVDVVKFGYLRRLKTNKSRYFVLRSSSKFGKARLEYFENEKKFSLHVNPRRSILLGECFNVCHVADKKHPHCFALFTKDDKFSLIASSQEEVNDWLMKIDELKKTSRRLGEFSLYDQVWFVLIKKAGLGLTKNLSGKFQMALSKSHLSFMRENSDDVVYQLPISNIRRRGQTDHYFYLEISRHDIMGPGELWIEVEDSEVARNMYDVIFGLRRSRIHTLNSSSSSRRVSSKKLDHYIMERGFRYETIVSVDNVDEAKPSETMAPDENHLFPKTTVDHRYSQMPTTTEHSLLANGERNALTLQRPASVDFHLLSLGTGFDGGIDSSGETTPQRCPRSLHQLGSPTASQSSSCSRSSSSIHDEDGSVVLPVPILRTTPALVGDSPGMEAIADDTRDHSSSVNSECHSEASVSGNESTDSNPADQRQPVSCAERELASGVADRGVALDKQHPLAAALLRGDSSCSTSCDENQDEKVAPKLPTRLSKKSRKGRYEYEDMSLSIPPRQKGTTRHASGDGYEKMDVDFSASRSFTKQKKTQLTMSGDVGSYVTMGDFSDGSQREAKQEEGARYMNLTLPPKKQGKFQTLPRYSQVNLKDENEAIPLHRSLSADLLYDGPNDMTNGDGRLHRSSCVSMESLQTARLNSRTSQQLKKLRDKVKPAPGHNRSHTLNVSPNSSSSPGASPHASPASSPRTGRRRLIDLTKHLRFRSARQQLKKQSTLPSSTFYVPQGKSKSKQLASPETYRRLNSQSAEPVEGERERSESRDSCPSPTLIRDRRLAASSGYVDIELHDGSPTMSDGKSMAESDAVRESVSLSNSNNNRHQAGGRRNGTVAGSGYEEITFDPKPAPSQPKDIVNSQRKEAKRRSSAPTASHPDYYINYSPTKLKASNSTKAPASPLRCSPAHDTLPQRTSQRKADRNMMYSDITLSSSPASPSPHKPLNDIPESGDPMAAKALPSYMNFSFNRSFSLPTDDDEDATSRSYENVIDRSTLEHPRAHRTSKDHGLSYADLDLSYGKRRTSSGFSDSSGTSSSSRSRPQSDMTQEIQDILSSHGIHKTLRNSYSEPSESNPGCGQVTADSTVSSEQQSSRYFQVDFMKSRGLADAVKSSRSGSVQSDA